MQEAFFGRVLLDKCKANGPDEFEQMSDDDKDDFVRLSNLAASKDLRKNKDPFEFPDSPPVPEGGASGGYRTESQTGDAPWLIQQQQQQQQQSQQLQPQQPQLKTQQPAAVSTESIVSASLPANQIALQPQQHDEDSDKDHNIGTSVLFSMPI